MAAPRCDNSHKLTFCFRPNSVASPAMRWQTSWKWSPRVFQPIWGSSNCLCMLLTGKKFSDFSTQLPAWIFCITNLFDVCLSHLFLSPNVKNSRICESSYLFSEQYKWKFPCTHSKVNNYLSSSYLCLHKGNASGDQWLMFTEDWTNSMSDNYLSATHLPVCPHSQSYQHRSAWQPLKTSGVTFVKCQFTFAVNIKSETCNLDSPWLTLKCWH